MAGEVAVVTGADRGIGRACALAFAAREMPVICVGRWREPLVETAEMVGERATAVVAHLGSERGPDKVRLAAALGGQVRALVHAAAVQSVGSLEEIDRMEFDELLDINLGGPLFLTQALLSHFADGAGVVFVGSLAAVRGRPGCAAYAASKAALHGLTVNLAAELAPRVRVNCVDPGVVEGEELDLEREARPGGRLAQPEDVAASIVHLALDASHCTGVIMPVDGGYTAR
ncbi:SDR family NAD(P)-dependent oxidoreductase [Pseudonocardia acaciae]|uniref:SDR family NAD(P)-dependent oxidoreductase n=1 Tax=Pseudonocardia acaciae TaxID=551276 RepID=UPI00048B5C12|nr:SDR family oxidoreductase [Pseudonocardia acaciae]